MSNRLGKKKSKNSKTAPLPEGAWTRAMWKAFWDVMSDDIDGMNALDPVIPGFGEITTPEEMLALIEATPLEKFLDAQFATQAVEAIRRVARGPYGTGNYASAAAVEIRNYANQIEQAASFWQPGTLRPRA